MRGKPQVVNLRLQHGEARGPRAGVAQYPDAIIVTKVELVFGFEVAGLAALKLIKGLRPPARFSEAVPFRVRNGLEVEKNSLGALPIRGKHLEASVEASRNCVRGRHLEIQAVETVGLRALAIAHDLDCSSSFFLERTTSRRAAPEMRYISAYKGRGSRVSIKGTPSLTNQQCPANSSLTWPMPKHRDTSIPSRRKK